MYMTNTFLFLKTLRLEAGTRAITVTPHPARLLRRRRIAAQPAAVTLGTTAADLSRTRVILAGRRDITIAGSAALTRQLLLTCQPAEINLGTSEAILQRTRMAGFIKTEITIEPQPARLLRNLVLKALPASVELTPNTANFLKVQGSIEAQPQAITIQGQPADLRAARLLTTSPAAVAVTPRPAQLLRAYPLVAQPVGIVALPRPAILRLSRVLKAVKQDIALSAKAANLAYDVPYSMAFVAGANNSADQTSYTYAGQSLGAAHALRYILVVVQSLSSGSAVASGLTVAGISATKLHERGGSNQSSYSYWIAAVPAGATGDIIVSYGATQLLNGIMVYRMINPPRLTPFATAVTTAATTKTVDVPSGGYVVGVGYTGTNTAATWTNLTEVYDLNVGSGRMSGAVAFFPSAVTAQSVTGASSGGIIGLISI